VTGDPERQRSSPTPWRIPRGAHHRPMQRIGHAFNRLAVLEHHLAELNLRAEAAVVANIRDEWRA